MSTQKYLQTEISLYGKIGNMWVMGFSESFNWLSLTFASVNVLEKVKAKKCYKKVDGSFIAIDRLLISEETLTGQNVIYLTSLDYENLTSLDYEKDLMVSSMTRCPIL